MVNNSNSARFGQGVIYTLAQSETGNSAQDAVILYGKGSDHTTENYGKRKGKKKIISQAMALALLDVAKKRRNKEMQKSLWNTYHCLNQVYSSDGKIYGNYCKNRICTICTAIRKAEKINTYYPILSKWSKPHMVTLTVRSCNKKNLKARLDACIRGIKIINARYRKKGERGTGKRLLGIRSLECNFNPIARTYNPHLHLIVPDLETAEILKTEWLKLWTPKYALPHCQHITRIWDLESALIEVIKYGTKIFTEPDVNNKAQGKGNSTIYVTALYNILDSMKGLRLFERFGFNQPKENEKEPVAARVTTDYQKWQYVPEFHDWLQAESEQSLFGYIPEEAIKELLEKCINLSLE